MKLHITKGFIPLIGLTVALAGTPAIRAEAFAAGTAQAAGATGVNQPPAGLSQPPPKVPPGPLNPGPIHPINNPTPLDCAQRATASLTANLTQIGLGGNAILSWSVQLPAGCADWGVKPLRLSGASVDMVGSATVAPIITTKFVLSVPILTDALARTTTNVPLATATVVVNLGSTVDIKGSTPDWKEVLIQALNTPNSTIHLAREVDMDLSGLENINIAPGVSLLGGLPCGPGALQARSPSVPSQSMVANTRLCGAHNAQEFGPRLFTTTPSQKALLMIAPGVPGLRWGCSAEAPSAHVHLSGFRLQGPHWDPVDGDDNAEMGIRIYGCRDVEIDNMELSGWAGAAIMVDDLAGIQQDPEHGCAAVPGPNSCFDAIKIHDNFIHHNQHTGKLGYGVEVDTPAWATIEHNVFDFNRHAITAGIHVEWKGGYLANENLVLKGGGWHNELEGYTQQFDVHGNKNCFPAGKSTWNCGRSGYAYWITNNSFQYTNGRAFALRGTPLEGAFVNNNTFAHSSVGDAVSTNGHGTIGLFIGPSKTNVDTFNKYGVCDFDGSGRDGFFQATGTTWWYISGAQRQWVYLNSMPETLEQLALGDFTGNGRCDVFTVRGDEWLISDGGRTPWRSLGHFGVPFEQLRFGHFTCDQASPPSSVACTTPGVRPASRSGPFASSIAGPGANLNTLDPGTPGGRRMQIFRRAPDGQWSVISPGMFDWTPLGSSPIPLEQLRFGNLNGHGITDVMAVQNGQCVVSWGGRTPWQPLNSQCGNLGTVLIGDLFGSGVDDIVSYSDGSWSVSRGGRGPWQGLYPSTINQSPPLVAQACGTCTARSYIGHFSGGPGTNLLVLSRSVPFTNRFTQILDLASSSFKPYGAYAD